ncbi:hypothetical protein F4860DRAFT_188322 [Xylaria cubensis]|nr:hypothetical protein F4860DRAFT_188322 [Xylaria cubensis]
MIADLYICKMRNTNTLTRASPSMSTTSQEHSILATRANIKTKPASVPWENCGADRVDMNRVVNAIAIVVVLRSCAFIVANMILITIFLVLLCDYLFTHFDLQQVVSNFVMIFTQRIDHPTNFIAIVHILEFQHSRVCKCDSLIYCVDNFLKL